MERLELEWPRIVEEDSLTPAMDSVIFSFLLLLPHLEDLELCPLPAHSPTALITDVGWDAIDPRQPLDPCCLQQRRTSTSAAAFRLAPQMTHLALGFALPFDQEDKIRWEERGQ